MKIKVVAHPNSSENRIEEKDKTLHAYVKARPEKGHANQQLINLLAKHFHTRPKNMKLMGKTSKTKYIEIK